MNYTGKQLKRVALKLKYVLVEGRKHTRVYDHEGRFVTTLPLPWLRCSRLRGCWQAA